MSIAEYIDIQDKFVEKFGHDKAMSIMHTAISWIHMSEELDKDTFVYDLNDNQSGKLKNELRTSWIRHAKA